MKKCFKCGINKELKEFYVHKQMADGHLNKCKKCTKNDSFENKKNFSNTDGSYDRTEKGVVRVIYKTQIRNSKLRKMEMPSYTKEELKQWMHENNFNDLFYKWVASGYDKNLKPSVDRTDDFKPYAFNNIKLGTWQENKNHQYEDVINGVGTGGLKCKPVQCFLNGRLLAEYVSFSSACRVVGYSIERSLKSGKPDRKNNFIWIYK